MQLMVKPTLECQFRCDFCSAANYQHDKQQADNLSALLSEIKKTKVNDIIVTGGDPLCVSPQFYEKLLEINDNITLSLTTNLWDFYINPKKWIKLFKNPRVGITTSFQYGDQRKKPNGQPYQESDFYAVEMLFKQHIGYCPSFISVISDENEKYALDHVLLAKQLNTTCKLNAQYPLGKSKTLYPRHKLLNIYLKIIESGLCQYEENVNSRQLGNCPFNTCNKCASHNRALCIKDGIAEYSFCEDLLYQNLLSTTDYSQLNENLYNSAKFMHQKCLTCIACQLCNGCLLHNMLLLKYEVNNEEGYCQKMCSIVKLLQKNGFKL